MTLTIGTGLAERAERVRAVAAAHADDVDAKGRFPREAVDAMIAERLLSIQVPAAFGGEGASLSEIAEVCSLVTPGSSKAPLIEKLPKPSYVITADAFTARRVPSAATISADARFQVPSSCLRVSPSDPAPVATLSPSIGRTRARFSAHAGKTSIAMTGTSATSARRVVLDMAESTPGNGVGVDSA